MKSKFSVATALMLLMATSAMASAFRAGDVVYLPAAGKAAGAAGSFFRTDVWISNLSNANVDVWIAFGARGADNSGSPAAAIKLATPLAPNERREILDIMQLVFGQSDLDPARVGHMIFFSCRVGGNCSDCDTNSTDCLPITVEARIFTTSASGTFGQLIPGIPWYNYVSPDAADRQLHKVFIVGIRQDPVNFRTNIGLVNASQFSSASLSVKLFQSNGTQFGNTFFQTLPPLGTIQPNVGSMFPGFSGTGAWVEIEQAPLTSGSDPGFLAYGSLLDNRSNDPTYLESQYTQQMDFDCVYGAKPERRLVRRQ
ncbi:MAG TPA: hypothetical protein VM557_07285 [Thermoanaerobaculia bacterium]|nr:hypothetical protein [Thermoanaerobaculia bacterium]